MQVQCVPSAFLLVVFSGAVGCGGGRAATETDDAGAKTGAPDAGAMTGDGAGRSMGADATDGAGEPAVIDLVDPGGLFLDEQGNLFVSDTNSAAFVVPTVLKIALATDTTWLIASNEILSTQSMAGDGAGNLYLPTGHGNTIVRVRTDTGSVTTLAGSTAGYFDGVGAAAQFRTPVGIAIDGKGNLFVAEFENETIRKIEIATGTVTTVAGAPMQTGSASGAGSAARFHDPTNLAYDRSTDRLYVADVGNGLVRQIDIGTNMVTTLAGDGDVGSQTDGTGTSAEFDAIGAMVADGNGTLYVGDRATIRKVALATGVVTTIVGTPGGSVSRDGTGASAFLTSATAIVLDGRGSLYFSGCETIRKLDLATDTIATLYGFPDIAHQGLLGCAAHGRPLGTP